MAKAKKKEYLIEDTIVIDNIYPLVESNLNTRVSSLKKCIERFINSRQAALYDYAPVDRIYFKKSDVNDFFKSINVDLKTVTNILPNLYYWKEDELQACKDEFSLTALMALRYLLREKKDNNIIELTAIYIAFSGKFFNALLSIFSALPTILSYLSKEYPCLAASSQPVFTYTLSILQPVSSQIALTLSTSDFLN